MNPINILFNGTREILNIVEMGDPLIDSLIIPNQIICPLINSKISLVRIDSGAHGTVFEITVPGKGTKKYIAKRGLFEIDSINMGFGPIIEGDERLTTIGMSLKVLKSFNPTLNFDENSELIRVNVPTTVGNIRIKECVTAESKTYEAIPYIDGENIEIPKGSYLCTNEAYSEYYIGTLLGNDYRMEKCINFFDVYSMFTCPDPDSKWSYYQYILMDKIDTTERSILQCMSSHTYHNIKGHSRDIQDGVYIQTMFAVAFYQTLYKISHNDLHENNVFIEIVKKTDDSLQITGTTFNGEYLADADWYHYQIGNVNIYLPAIPIIVKIGDFGQSVKYSHPIVGDETVFRTGYNNGRKWGPLIPNQFIPQYDSVYHTTCYIRELAAKSRYGYMGNFLKKCLEFLIPPIGVLKTDATDKAMNILISDKMIDSKSKRPKLKKLLKCRSSYDLLTSSVMDKYCIKPSRGKIITLGVIY